ncbi:LysE family translocator [Streptomyces drozdowiczii]|uniref:LysE family translocator n=2 Tax=Streptomyces drozdowiczii TaxID=202862 RepID=A0ABY6PKJ7_9ACTN|nr:LysE family translocator [Streptomyces drozdowiczii]MCX0241907.1 LysE family translocator [Streptomyces drozdowiczii]UZK52735.1 LysE family translocator [Streptomyces drozdowiczii]UZK57981.1 LysE family translocator [Streptomyces drozdowiczii]
MPDLTLLPAYLAAVAIITIAPGPDSAYIVAVALERGPRAGLLSALGMALGMVAHVTAAALGLAVLLRSIPAAQHGVELAGGLYLGWLALTTVRSARTPPAAAGGTLSAGRVLRRAALTNVLNPKTVLFFAAFLPRFTTAANGPLWVQLLVLGLVFLIAGLVWDSLLGLCAGRLGRGLAQGRRTATAVNLVTATTFALLALFLLHSASAAVVA